MRAILDRADALVPWIEARIPGAHFPPGTQAIGVESDAGEIMGAVAFHDWAQSFGTIQVSAAAQDPRWMRARATWDAMFAYCWDQLGVQKIYALTPRSNERALRFVWGLGFQAEAIIPRHFGKDEDAVLSSIFREAHRGQEL